MQNRDLQMKYDIAKNEDGPLRRTLKSGAPANTEPAPSTSKSGVNGAAENMPSADRYPGLDERLQDIEKHLALPCKGRWEMTKGVHHMGRGRFCMERASNLRFLLPL